MSTRVPTQSPRVFHRPARLALLTFLAVTGTMLLTGAFIVPWLIQRMEQRYLEIQSDLNARQARAVAQFAALRLSEGGTEETVQNELQALLAGADADRGYSCVIDQEDTEFVCHPMTMALGMPISSKNADFFASAKPAERAVEPWERAVSRGVLGGGSLRYGDGSTEIIYMAQVPGTKWTVTTHENTTRVQSELNSLKEGMILGAGVIGFLLAIPSSLAARAVGQRAETKIDAERQRSEQLVLNILPQPIAERLKTSPAVIADRHPQITVLFADIVGFTPWAAGMRANELVGKLNHLFSRFDDICEKHGVEKIKTIGDAYMLCGGLDGAAEDGAVAVVTAGLEMIEVMKQFATEEANEALSLRIGIHTGELIAGVIGKRKFSYDLWGDVVNVAARLESNGVPNRIQLSRETRELVSDHFEVEFRGEIELKGKGKTPVWLANE